MRRRAWPHVGAVLGLQDLKLPAGSTWGWCEKQAQYRDQLRHMVHAASASLP